MTDPQPDAKLRAVLAQLRWRVHPERFVVVGLEPRERLLALQLLPGITEPFAQFFVEPDELTLVLAESDWREMYPAFPHARVLRPYRVISFDNDLPPDLVGFMAAISKALAHAGVPLLPICGHSRDHLLVRDLDLDTALKAIATLAAGCQAPAK